MNIKDIETESKNKIINYFKDIINEKDNRYLIAMIFLEKDNYEFEFKMCCLDIVKKDKYIRDPMATFFKIWLENNGY